MRTHPFQVEAWSSTTSTTPTTTIQPRPRGVPPLHPTPLLPLHPTPPHFTPLHPTPLHPLHPTPLHSTPPPPPHPTPHPLSWLRIVPSVFTEAFFKGELRATPTLNFFFEAIDEAVEKVRRECGEDTEITFLGHSIGGWVMRAYLTERPDVRAKTSNICSLGSPNRSPPSGTVWAEIDQTRGLLKSVNSGWQELDERPPTLCVIGRGTQGGLRLPIWDDEVGRSTALEGVVAASSYLALCGNAFAVGDGLIPVEAATVEVEGDGAAGVKTLEIEDCNHRSVGGVAGRQGGRAAGRQGGRTAGRQGGRVAGWQGGRVAGQGGRMVGRWAGPTTRPWKGRFCMNSLVRSPRRTTTTTNSPPLLAPPNEPSPTRPHSPRFATPRTPLNATSGFVPTPGASLLLPESYLWYGSPTIAAQWVSHLSDF